MVLHEILPAASPAHILKLRLQRTCSNPLENRSMRVDQWQVDLCPWNIRNWNRKQLYLPSTKINFLKRASDDKEAFYDAEKLITNNFWQEAGCRANICFHCSCQGRFPYLVSENYQNFTSITRIFLTYKFDVDKTETIAV